MKCATGYHIEIDGDNTDFQMVECMADWEAAPSSRYPNQGDPEWWGPRGATGAAKWMAVGGGEPMACSGGVTVSLHFLISVNSHV